MNFSKFLKISIIFLIIFSWIFSGFPAIWQNPRIPPEIKEAKALNVTAGDGLVIYGQSGNTTPQWRTYSSTNNNFSSAAGTVSGATGLQFIIRTSPTKQEAIAGYEDTSGNLYIMCYNGTSWSNEWSVAVGGTGTTRRFDIAYESNSGDVMVVYSTNAANTNELAYRTKSGSTGCGSANWSSATNIDAQRTSGAVLWVSLASQFASSSNTIGLAWLDANGILSAMGWTGSSWSIAEPSSAFNTIALEYISTVGDMESFGIAVESNTGYIMVTWSVNGTTCTANSTTESSSCARYARYTSSWSSPAYVPTVADRFTTMAIAANYSSNQILLAGIADDSQDLSLAVWSGSAWTGSANVDTSCATPAAGTKFVATGWLVSGANTYGVVTYYDSGATNVGWYTFDGTTWTKQTDWSPTPAFGTQKYYDIQVDPINKDRLIFTVGDANSDFFAKRLILSGTTFTWSNADGGAALEANGSSASYEFFSFAYWRYVPITYTQAAYRFYNNIDSTDVGTPLANLNTAASLSHSGQDFRLRLLLGIDSAPLAQSGQSFKLQYAQKSGSICGDDETFSDITSTSTIAFYDNPTPSDGANLTANANDPTDGSRTIVNQTYEEANPFTNSSAAIPSGQDGKWDFSLKDNSNAATSTTYCLRAVKADGSLLNTYTYYPEITVVPPLIFSGTVYQTDESTPLSQALSIKLAVASSTVFSTTTDANGNFSFAVNSAVASGTVVTIWLDTSGATSASLVFKYGSSCTGYPNCTGLSLYQNRVTIDNKYGGNITNADLASCDNNSGSACSDSDIGFTSESGVLTLTFATNMLKISSGVTFAPGGNVNAQKLRVAGTYSGNSETLTLSGSGTGATCGLADQMPLCVDGTYTASNNTTKFTGTSTTTIALNSNFYNLDLSPAAAVTYILGTASGQTLTVNGTLNIGDGTNALTVAANTNNPNISVAGDTTIKSNATFTLGSGTQTLAGNLTVDGTLNGSGSITVNGSVNGTGVINLSSGTFEQRTASNQTFGTTNNSNAWTFYNLKFSASTASTITFNSGGTGDINITNVLTIGGSSAPTSTVNFSNRNIVLSGSGTPFAVTSYGVFQSASSTFNFSGASQTIAPQTYYNLTLSGSGTPILTGLTTINNNFLLSGSVNPSTAANLSIGGNLQINNGNTLTVPSTYTLSVGGATTIAGTLALSSTAASGHNFTGDVTISASTGVWNNSGNAPVTFGGSLTNNNTFTAGNGTYTFTGTSKTISGTVSIPNLAISGTIQNNGTLTVSNTLSGTGTLTQGSGSTLYLGGTINISTLDASTNSNTVVYNGSSSQTIKATTYSSLTLNNSAGATIAGDVTVNGTLSLSGGNITTNDYAVIISSTGSVSRTSGYIIGNLKKYIGTGATSKTFEIGDANVYAPIDVSFGNVTTAGYLTAKTTSGDHLYIANSGIDSTKSVNRYWTMTNSGIVFNNYSATFYFATSDIDVGADWNNFIVAKYDGNWTLPTVGTKTATSTQATGMTSFSDYQVGEALPVSITLTITPSNVNLGTLIPGIPITVTSTATVTATNASLGYNLLVKRDSSTSTLSYLTNTFPDYTAWDPTANGGNGNATTTPGSTFSFRVNYTGTTSNYNSTWWGTNDNDGTAKYGGMPVNSQQIMTCNSSSCQNGTTDTIIKYRADAPASQPIGDYSGSITITALPNL